MDSRKLLSRLTTSLLWVLAVFVFAAAFNLIGIYLLGDIIGWSRWLQIHSLHFLAWRLCLYGGTAYGWWWMRNRVLRREAAAETRSRFRRAEVAAVLTVLALETAVFVQSP